jgi:hypothetical protein
VICYKEFTGTSNVEAVVMPSKPSPFKTKEVTPVQKLAYYWTRLDDTTKGYFEQLYKMYPQDVSEVLAGEALLPAANCKTLQDWVDGRGGGEALDASNFQHVYISIAELRAEPAQVDRGGKFKVVWTGEAQADFPAREDRLVIADKATDKEVRNMTLTYPEIKAGAVQEEIDCAPLPDGVYTVVLTVNIDGTDHGTELTAQGIRNMSGIEVFVGDSKAAMQARLLPILAQIHGQAIEVTRGERVGPETARAIKELARSVGDIDQVGWGPGGGPRSEESQAIYSLAERLPDDTPPADFHPAAWPALRERLQGMTNMITIDEMGAFQERLRAWLDDYGVKPS